MQDQKQIQILERRIQQAVTKRNAAKRFSSTWFQAKAEIEALQAELNEINFAIRSKSSVPADAVFVDWDTYDDD